MCEEVGLVEINATVEELGVYGSNERKTDDLVITVMPVLLGGCNEF